MSESYAPRFLGRCSVVSTLIVGYRARKIGNPTVLIRNKTTCKRFKRDRPASRMNDAPKCKRA